MSSDRSKQAKIAWVCLTRNGYVLARKLATQIPNSVVYGKAGRTCNADFEFDDTINCIQTLFNQHQIIVGVCATGILIRALGHLLAGKIQDSPVIALAENGANVVPLLGGHHGANKLAKNIAALLNINASITTASENRFGISLDDPPVGWVLANPKNHKAFVASLLEENAVRIDQNVSWLTNSELPVSETASLEIVSTHKRVEGSNHRLIYNSKTLTIGVGCERGTPSEELVALVEQTLQANALAAESVAGVYSIDLKEDEAAVHTLADQLNVTARFFSAVELETHADKLKNPSDIVFNETGCHGVAEGAALAAAGENSKLIVEKSKSKRATCAIALTTSPLVGNTVGKPRGRLLVVGIGPGNIDWRTPAASNAITCATDIVGYSLYLDLVEDLVDKQHCHRFDLGKETARVQKAVELAAMGKTVALICSGDPGIYAMATLVFELINHKSGQIAWKRIEIEVIPGISALQTAAAKSGAPLGHDFCAISLSDLLTPWETIQQRVKAAAEGDFVIAFYNPVSKQRHWQLGKARQILLQHRPANTPVVVGRNLGRDGESVSVTTLELLNPAKIDMLTVVLVGASNTQTVELGNRLVQAYTPRGYAKKSMQTSAGNKPLTQAL